MTMRVWGLALATAAAAATAVAAPAGGADDKAVRERIVEAVRKINPNLNVQDVGRTPIKGVREVVVNGQVVYVTEDGRYMLQGDIVDLQARQSLTERRRDGLRVDVLAKVDKKDMLIYPAKGETKHVLTVVTDIDCPYCRRFHQHMDEINALGIEVRYLLMPRAGVGSPSYVKAINVWCADDPHAAMTAAKQGKPVEDRKCDHPVDRHMQLAEQMGINATPTSVTKKGSIIAGYVPPKELLQRLEAMKASAK